MPDGRWVTRSGCITLAGCWPSDIRDALSTQPVGVVSFSPQRLPGRMAARPLASMCLAPPLAWPHPSGPCRRTHRLPHRAISAPSSPQGAVKLISTRRSRWRFLLVDSSNHVVARLICFMSPLSRWRSGALRFRGPSRGPMPLWALCAVNQEEVADAKSRAIFGDNFELAAKQCADHGCLKAPPSTVFGFGVSADRWRCVYRAGSGTHIWRLLTNHQSPMAFALTLLFARGVAKIQNL
jgi:hypothetical protein